MPHPSPLQTAQANSYTLDPAAAVNEIKGPLLENNTSPNVILFFCSADYPLDKLGEHLKIAFPNQTVIGCTSCGQINQQGFSDAKLSAIGLSGGIEAKSYLINLDNIESDISTLARTANDRFSEMSRSPAFGILNIDGLAQREELVAAELYKALPPFPFVGGSAGDDLKLKKTSVYYEGKFLSGHAVFSIFETRLPHSTLKIEHYSPTDDLLVVTESDPNKRIIYEINGEPAAEVYARSIGKKTEELTEEDFIVTPLLFGLGNQQFVRDVQHLNPDGSLSLFCAIETGLVLTIGKPHDIIQSTLDAFANLKEKINKTSLIIGFDCIHRKMGLDMKGLTSQAGDIYKENKVFGFSTYGEQYNGIHINQTFSGIAIGEPNEPF